MPQGQPARVPDDGLSTRQRRNKPLIMVHTGPGKGKSTAAFGLAIRAWNTGTGIVNGRGEAAVEFRAPVTPGEEAYACTPHGEMMRGTIRVE